MPSTSHPRFTAERTAARITAFRPGASPPPVEIAIFTFVRRRSVQSAPASTRRSTRLNSDQRYTPLQHGGRDRTRRSLATLRRFERFDDLSRLGVAPDLRFLEYRPAVGNDFEASAARWNQRDVGIGKPLTNLRRQTGGASFVASHRAVFDRDSHGSAGLVKEPRWPIREHAPRRHRGMLFTAAMRLMRLSCCRTIVRSESI